MIWEKGVIVRNGHEESWTAATVCDGAGKPVVWGSHPLGAALPADSIAVHAPAVLHITFPDGTTSFRIDALADPVNAKDGSMQPAPLDHPPSEDELHFVMFRFVFGAPGSKRQAKLNKWSVDFGNKINSGCGYIPRENGCEAYLAPEVLAHWGITVKAPMPDEAYRSDAMFYLNPLHQTASSILRYAAAQDIAVFTHLREQLSGTVEARDALAKFLVKQKVAVADAGAALQIVPTGLSAQAKEQYDQLLAAARIDEQRLLGCARAHIGAFAERAWRQAPPAETLEQLLKFYKQGRDEGLCYQAAVKRALLPVLASPYFLYREQRGAPPGGALRPGWTRAG